MKKIPITVTTYKRTDLFKQTIDSLYNCNLDNALVERIILFDNGSDEEEITIMVNECKKFNFFVDVIICNEKGHENSLNKILELDYKFIFHIEDDWLFLEKFNFISKGIEILENNKKINQVVFRKEKGISNNCDIEYNSEFMKEIYNIRNKKQWPPYTLNPSIQNLDLIKKVGKFQKPEFEYNFALKCHNLGYEMVYSKKVFVKHLGENLSAYSINKTTK